MSQLSENPDLMLEVLAKLVNKLGGYVEVGPTDHPSGAFNLASKFDKETGTLKLHLIEDGNQVGNA